MGELHDLAFLIDWIIACQASHVGAEGRMTFSEHDTYLERGWVKRRVCVCVDGGGHNAEKWSGCSEIIKNKTGNDLAEAETEIEIGK